MNIIEAVSLKKVFKDFWGHPKAIAIDDINFKVSPGIVFGILGPNGCGKSTTIKLMLGLLKPSSGLIKIFNHHPDSVKIKHQIGYLPEETYLYHYLTAFETLKFFGSLFNLSYSERRKRSSELLEMVGLEHASHRLVGEFSKGMARRIGLAQALINDPELIILDEPTSGLDPIGCGEIKSLIRFLSERGKTIVICSHLLADIEDICDEVIIMYAGKIRACGPLNPLLIDDQKTQITTPVLEADVLEKILEILNESGLKENVSIDKPAINLEHYFLDVVQQAQNEISNNYGAQTAGHIADFLFRTDNPEELLQKYQSNSSDLQNNGKNSEIKDSATNEPEVLEKLTTTPNHEKSDNKSNSGDSSRDDVIKDILDNG